MAEFKSLYVTSHDGLRLHARDYGTGNASSGIPVVCLPGLSRNAADFDSIAKVLNHGSGGPGRRVLAIDYRGRGLSDYDKDWKNYNIIVEQADILAILAAAGIEKAVFLGTSRGGIHIMFLAESRPELIHAAIMNDIGPVLETPGLMRIKGYIGKYPAPRNLTEAVALLKKINGDYFTGLTVEEWEAYAKTSYYSESGQWGSRYDPQLTKQIEAWKEDEPSPPLWQQFDRLANIPLLVIRGQNSDLLSEATLLKMSVHHPGLESFTVGGQGHAPLLLDDFSISKINQFIRSTGPARLN